ncbi:MAG: calcium-binding protein [Verrucomicrobiae bacterium]|nr:calcium-binding protein [Verrucomicrobiae bacterium]
MVVHCKSGVYPLKKGEMIKVVGMVDNGDHGLPEMTVKINWQGRILGVPLEQIEGVKVDATTQETISDWHYWCDQGRCF